MRPELAAGLPINPSLAIRRATISAKRPWIYVQDLRDICRAIEQTGHKRKNSGRTWDLRIVLDIINLEASGEGSQ